MYDTNGFVKRITTDDAKQGTRNPVKYRSAYLALNLHCQYCLHIKTNSIDMKYPTSALLLASLAQTAFVPAVFGFTAASNMHRAAKLSPWGATAPRSSAVNTALSKYAKDTLSELPPFDSKEEYEEYLMEASGLPKGFETGSAIGSFVPEEAPSMGSLKIKGTIIHLTDGPTENWAAVFTQNKVSVGVEFGYPYRCEY